jgi:hypothetical protein
MRILCIVDCYLPSTKSSAKLMHDLAVGMRSRGHDVTVAAPDDQLDQPCTVSQDEGVTALRIRTGRIKGANLLTRGINEARLSSAAGVEFVRRRHSTQAIGSVFDRINRSLGISPRLPVAKPQPENAQA